MSKTKFPDKLCLSGNKILCGSLSFLITKKENSYINFLALNCNIGCGKKTKVWPITPQWLRFNPLSSNLQDIDEWRRQWLVLAVSPSLLASDWDLISINSRPKISAKLEGYAMENWAWFLAPRTLLLWSFLSWLLLFLVFCLDGSIGEGERRKPVGRVRGKDWLYGLLFFQAGQSLNEFVEIMIGIQIQPFCENCSIKPF